MIHLLLFFSKCSQGADQSGASQEVELFVLAPPSYTCKSTVFAEQFRSWWRRAR